MRNTEGRSPSLRPSDREILEWRGPKNAVRADRPYAYFVEPERTAYGTMEETAVILLTSRECPFRCLMCDLWRNTLDERVPIGAITGQIDFALSRLPPVQHVKLYNSGNFFDAQAIPPEEYRDIARRLSGMRTVVVENHPRLCGDACRQFRDLLPDTCELEVALGLETAHPDILARLNKHMTLGDFTQAVHFLGQHQISTRAFILLRPPYLSESEGKEWALKSIEFAFTAGARCCSVIPTRGGNGVMEQLRVAGDFEPPGLKSLENVLETALVGQRARVFADLWDVDRLPSCALCRSDRVKRIQEMNRSQRVPPPVTCFCEGGR